MCLRRSVREFNKHPSGQQNHCVKVVPSSSSSKTVLLSKQLGPLGMSQPKPSRLNIKTMARKTRTTEEQQTETLTLQSNFWFKALGNIAFQSRVTAGDSDTVLQNTHMPSNSNYHSQKTRILSMLNIAVEDSSLQTVSAEELSSEEVSQAHQEDKENTFDYVPSIDDKDMQQDCHLEWLCPKNTQKIDGPI